MIADPNYPASDKPDKWRGHKPGTSPEPACPVQSASWSDAILFCNWLSAQEKRRPCYQRDAKQQWVYLIDADGYRLPTEAEWERACRAGTTTRFSFGNDAELLKWHGRFLGNSKSRAWPVGEKLPNALGLFDMHGNIDEWCWDWHAAFTGDATDPAGPPQGTLKVARGGGWHVLAPLACRSGIRFQRQPDTRNTLTGFRVACGTTP